MKREYWRGHRRDYVGKKLQTFVDFTCWHLELVCRNQTFLLEGDLRFPLCFVQTTLFIYIQALVVLSGGESRVQSSKAKTIFLYSAWKIQEEHVNPPPANSVWVGLAQKCVTQASRNNKGLVFIHQMNVCGHLKCNRAAVWSHLKTWLRIITSFSFPNGLLKQ